MELWFTEKQTLHLGITCSVKETLLNKKTPYQELAVLDTHQFGRMLVLDGMVQTTEKDEFVYHEMIAHVAMQTHPEPKRVLVVGGGDGGVLREVVKYQELEKVVLAEIDAEVIEASKKYFPSISTAFQHPKVEVMVGDGIAHIKEHQGIYDVIIVDSTEPIGPAAGLFSREFYQAAFESLQDEGILVAQTESPFYNQEIIKNSFSTFYDIFPTARLYLASIPTYPSGLWSFTIGSKKYEPISIDKLKDNKIETKYYNLEIHKSAFSLPSFVKEIIKQESA